MSNTLVQQNFTFTVPSGRSAPSAAGVHICWPTNGVSIDATSVVVDASSSMRIPASWLRSTAIPASTWWTRSPRAPRCPVCSPLTASTAPATSTVACAPQKTPTLLRAVRTSWCSRRLAGGAGRYQQASSRVYADHRHGARTWRARSRPCASRAAASR
jgi:hypothetical protein